MAAKENGLVNARWVGFAGNLADGTPLVPGETVIALSRQEAEESLNWEPIGGPVKDEKADS